MKCLLVLMGLGCCFAMSDGMETAECKFEGSLSGTVTIHHMDNANELHFMGKIMNLAPGKHGFHVHEFGKLTNQCKDAGGHFNPDNKNHGSLISTERHAGDLENIEANESKVAMVNISLKNSKLEDFIGKSIVVHERIDDLGLGGHQDSLKTGNAGARIDCCIIQMKGSGHNAAVETGGVVFAVLTGLMSLFL